jgi:hypothetical protein
VKRQFIFFSMRKPLRAAAFTAREQAARSPSTDSSAPPSAESTLPAMPPRMWTPDTTLDTTAADNN